MPPLALFHSTVQAAGPNLSARRSTDALFHSRRSRRSAQPYLTWGDHGYWPSTDYNGIDDATLIWWDPAATGPDEIRKDGTGMWQYVDGGKRYLPGEWPTDRRRCSTRPAPWRSTRPRRKAKPRRLPQPRRLNESRRT